ncbi:c-type cytochrome [Mesorhizobium sp.]|uniref:c-type cytochrome n=1 Tax=Mesorhizobium sp. TaxID=1871066 RepID=UPI0025E9E931|nr:c-type cytochrome [Mesorhizobium sp.]
MTGKLRHRRVFSMRPVARFAIATGLVLLFSQSGAAAGTDQGAQLAATCASCHRLDGGGTGIPSIIGLGEERLTNALLAYRASENPNHIMHVIALSLSDEEIASVARYVAAQGSNPR